MEGKTKFSRRLKQSDGLTDLDPRLLCYDRSTPLYFVILHPPKRLSVCLCMSFSRITRKDI